ncbi:MAG: Gfo/Idh/MocA family oxidoreductase [Clostridiaceae bacterium]|nr:Gfo/Idh/MocA family oxidoreductase [Clostridiaceae bacterium]
MKGYGIIGAGAFGAEYARIISQMENCKLITVYSPGQGAKRVSQEVGCKAVSNIEDLLSDKNIDAVIVVSPNYLHKEHVIAAAKAGKQIYCEKPVALSVSDVKEMLDACRSAGVTFMVGHIMHYYAGIAEVKRRIDEGEFGVIVNAHVERTGWEDKQEKVSWKKMQDKSGGHLFHHIHEIDIVQWIMGNPEIVYCAGGNFAHKGPGFGDEDDILLVTVTFKNGVASFQYGSGFRMGNHFIRINGTKASALISFPEAKIKILHENKEIEEIPLFSDEKSAKAIFELFSKTDGGIHYAKPGDRPPEYIQVSLREEIELFNSVINGASYPEDKKDLFDGTSAINSVAISEAALISKEKGMPIKIEN